MKQKTFDILNRLYKSGELYDLYAAGIITQRAVNIVQSVNRFLIYKPTFGQVRAMELIAREMKCTTVTVWRYLRDGGAL